MATRTISLTFKYEEETGGWDEDLLPSILDYLDENWDTPCVEVKIQKD